MRRLVASMVLFAAGTTPASGAPVTSVAAGFYECYVVEVVLPPYEPMSTRVCRPVATA